MNLSYKDRYYIDKKLKELTYWKEIEKVVWSNSNDIKYACLTREFVRRNLEKVARSIMKRALLNPDDWTKVVAFVSIVINGAYTKPGDSYLFEKCFNGELV